MKFEEKMRKVKLLHTQDCEAGYDPGLNILPRDTNTLAVAGLELTTFWWSSDHESCTFPLDHKCSHYSQIRYYWFRCSMHISKESYYICLHCIPYVLNFSKSLEEFFLLFLVIKNLVPRVAIKEIWHFQESHHC